MIIGEVAVIVTLVGWFVTPNITDLINEARCWASSNYKWYTGLPEKLQKLAEDLEVIRDTVDAARMGFNNDQTRNGRLWRLKDAIHDAEEIMDAFELEILEANLKRRHQHRKAVDSSVDLAKQALGTKKSLDRLKELVERLDELRRSSEDLRQVSQHGVRPISRETTTPLSSKAGMPFGYDKEYAQLLSKLLVLDDSNLVIGKGKSKSECGGDARVVAIIGHGGMGKTELARRAYNDQENVRGKFDLFIWVCAYAKFTKNELLREIWNSAAGAKLVGEMNDTSLEEELIKMVVSKKYLLVLDDVCNNESVASEFRRKKTWDGVLAPFKQHGERDSRILITTRAKICSTTLNAGASIVLNGIDTQATVLLLKKTAFGDEHTDVPDGLQKVFEHNVCNLQGSPLAAEVVGGKLKQNYSESEWKKNLKEDHEDVDFAHLSSYQDLYSPQLQRCFAFCSMFPNKWRFEREKLIKMWIAHGFIEGTSDGGKSMEDVATRYFDDLLSRSLFEEATDGVGDKETKYYVIREHIHSMIRQVSANYCFVSRSTLTIPATVRHLSVSSGCLDQLKAYSGRLGKVRTLLVFKDDPSSTSSPLSAIDSDIIKEFKGVRVLDLTDTGITELPESIGKLKHLRYLGLPNTMRKLRAEVTRLLLLQTFIVGKNCQLDEFPDDMNSLINLRHLDLDIKYIAKIGGIGRLDKLQGSVEFHADKRKEGHSMSELADMNSLRRTLSIKGLEKVATKEEAEDARLRSKQFVKVLKLEWEHPDPRPGASAGSSDAVLEGLRPDCRLQELRITRYPGTASPTWLADAGVLENLTSLYLRNCRKLQSLPPVGRLPCLRLLIVKELCSVERIGRTFCGDPGTAFQALEKIVLDDMPKLVAWDAEDQSTGVGNDLPAALFPQLREVRISDCPLISSLSGLGGCRRSLRSLCVERCPGITEKSLPANFSTSGFPSLAGGLRIVESNLQLESLPAS